MTVSKIAHLREIESVGWDLKENPEDKLFMLFHCQNFEHSFGLTVH